MYIVMWISYYLGIFRYKYEICNVYDLLIQMFVDEVQGGFVGEGYGDFG